MVACSACLLHSRRVGRVDGGGGLTYHHGVLALAINCGSSSLKFAMVDLASGERRLAGLAERLDGPEAALRWNGGMTALPGAGHAEVLREVVALVAAAGIRPAAIGHRIVHGGERFTATTPLRAETVAALRTVTDLAPLHNPANLRGIEAALAAWPEVPQFGVFDTAFHASMPARAFRYAVPEAWYREHGIRRYGFHGISHAYVARRATAVLGRADAALVTAHLGNGCSATAVLAGRSLDTTMGMTPLEGLVMGTRSGDLDPGLHEHLCARLGIDIRALTRLLNRESGLAGLSGRGNDLRAIEAAAGAGDARAALAIEVMTYRLAKAIAGLVVAMGRLDALVFTGGIGENSPGTRAAVAGHLGFLGIRLDAEANASHGRARGGRIDRGDGGPALLVIPTDE
jgi:acetate kinase